MGFETAHKPDSPVDQALSRVDAVPVPGKQTLTDQLGPRSGPVGHDYVDDGAACDRAPAAPGCFLTDRQRDRLIGVFRTRVTNAGLAYQKAVGGLQVRQLLQKDDDLSWMLTMVLDVAGAHLLGMAAKAITGVLAHGMSALERVTTEAAVEGVPLHGTAAGRTQQLLSGIDERWITMHIRGIVDVGKRAVGGKLKAQDHSVKENALDLLHQLGDQAFVGFAFIGEHLPVATTDAQLIPLFDAMAAEHHTPSLYYEALDQKVQRYTATEIGQIGITYPEQDPHGMVERGTKVAWAIFESGYPQELVYRVTETGLATGGAGHLPHWLRQGESIAMTRPVPVPAEFTEVALARHRQVWGGEPETIHVDDSEYFWDSARVAAALRHKREPDVLRRAVQREIALLVATRRNASQAVAPPVQVPPQLQLATDRSTVPRLQLPSDPPKKDEP